mgnify:CR=1 FL=1
MGIRFIKSNHLFLLFGLLTKGITGQNSLYFHPGIPQSGLLNPVFTSSCNYVGIPGLSSFYVSYDNTAFSYNQLFPRTGDGSRVPNPGFLEKRMHALDLVETRFSTNLLSIGLWHKDSYFHFHIAEKVDLLTTIPQTAVDLAWEGNTQYVGQGVEVNRLGLRAFHFREYALSATKWIDPTWKIGLRPKLLFGKLNLQSRNEELYVFTEDENFDLDIDASYEINGSIPVTLDTNAAGNVTSINAPGPDVAALLFNRKNPGLSLDFGARYRYTEQIDFFASILDLGFIRWRNNLNNVSVDQGFRFTGLSEEDLGSENYLDALIDSISSSWEMNTSSEPYTTWLPLKFYAGARYKLNQRFSAGMLSRTLLFRERLYPSFTLSAHAQFLDAFSFTLSYSYRNYSFNNLGVGFSIQNKSAQFYAVTDNLLALSPLNTRTINVRFGLNIFFNCRNPQRERKNDIPAVSSNKGCSWIQREKEQQKNKPHPKK